jgi:hypothetical protein
MEEPEAIGWSTFIRRPSTPNTENTHKGAGRDCIDLTPSSHAEPTEVLAGEGDAHGKVKARSHLETPRSRGAAL